MCARMLAEMYLRTGDARYLEPIPPLADWLERVNSEIAAQKYPLPRYWEPGTNKPLYVVRTGKFNAEGYGLYVWTTDPAKARCNGEPCKADGKPVFDTAPLRKEYDALQKLTTSQARAARLAELRARSHRQPRSKEDVAAIVKALDARGAWVTDDNVVPVPNAPGEAQESESVRGISTRVFTERMEALIGAL
jgi:hypothetical protein